MCSVAWSFPGPRFALPDPAGTERPAAGYNTDGTITIENNNILIGSNTDITAGQSSPLDIGNLIYCDVTGGTVGIGVATPAATLDVGGTGLVRGCRAHGFNADVTDAGQHAERGGKCLQPRRQSQRHQRPCRHGKFNFRRHDGDQRRRHRQQHAAGNQRDLGTSTASGYNVIWGTTSPWGSNVIWGDATVNLLSTCFPSTY